MHICKEPRKSTKYYTESLRLTTALFNIGQTVVTGRCQQQCIYLSEVKPVFTVYYNMMTHSLFGSGNCSRKARKED